MNETNLNSESLRYILFLIDSKIKEHDGKIFCSLESAKNYAIDCLKDNYCNKAVIGMFYMEHNKKELMISMVETLGFPGDKKNINQLELFHEN